MTARSMSLPMLASPRAMDPKEDDGLHVVADRSRTVSVSAVIGSRGTRRGATEKWSSLMVCARPTDGLGVDHSELGQRLQCLLDRPQALVIADDRMDLPSRQGSIGARASLTRLHARPG